MTATETKATHTPGPWRRGEVRKDCIVTDHGAIDEITLCHLPGWTRESDELDANARLIAAAPELLEVLLDVKGMLPVAGRLHPDDLFNLQTRVCAAIEKATQ